MKPYIKPWIFVKGTHFIGTDEEDPQTICYIDDHRNDRAWSPSERKQIGALIAAAPELLIALAELLAAGERGLDQSATHEGFQNCDALAKARAALEKARG